MSRCSPAGRGARGVLFVLGVLGVIGPGHALAQKHVVLFGFTSPQALEAHDALAAALASTHTVTSQSLAGSQAASAGLPEGCGERTILGLVQLLSADAVVCATSAVGAKLSLAVHGGPDGRLLKRIDTAQSKRAVAAVVPRISALVGQGSRPATAPGWRMGTRSAETTPADPLLEAHLAKLSAPAPVERVAAVAALAARTPPATRAMVPLACTLLADQSLPVRKAAASRAAQLLDVAVLSSIKAALELETDAEVRDSARATLDAVPQQVEVLVGQLKGGTAEQRARAAQVLGRMAPSAALPALIAAVGDPDARVREQAAEGLRQFLKPGAISALKRARRDGTAAVREVAERALKDYERMSAWHNFYISYTRIEKKCDAREPSWRAEAAVALGINAASNAVPRLSGLLRQDPDEGVRLAAAWALAAIDRANKTPAAVDALTRAAQSDPGPRVRAAARAFLDAGQARAEVLVAQLGEPAAERRRLAAEVLALRADGRALSALLRAAYCDADDDVRSAAILGLARLGEASATSAVLLAVFRDPAEPVRRRAMMGFALVGWDDALEGPSGPSEETRAWAGKDQEDPLKTAARVTKAATPAPAPEPVTERCPTDCPALTLSVGPSMLFVRDFGVGNPKNDLDGRGITSTPVAGIQLGAEVYPAAFWTKGWAALLGLGLRYARYFGISWSTETDPDTSHDVTHQSILVDLLRVRFQPVRRPTLPTLLLRIGVQHLEFAMNDEAGAEAHIPDVAVTSAVLGIGVDIPIRSVHLALGLDYLPSPSFGEITDDDEYGDGSGWGLMVQAGLGGRIWRSVGWKLDLLYTHYALDFEGILARRQAESATDHYLNGLLHLTWSI